MPTPELVSTVQDAVTLLIDRGKAALADKKLTFAEIRDVAAATFEVVCELVDYTRSLPASPEEKKTVILAGVGRVYAEVIAPLDVPHVPEYFEGAFVDPILGSAMHAVTAGLLDALLRRDAKASVPILAA